MLGARNHNGGKSLAANSAAASSNQGGQQFKHTANSTGVSIHDNAAFQNTGVWQGATGTRYPTRTRNIFQYPIRTRLIFKIIGYFGYRVLEKNQVFDMNP